MIEKLASFYNVSDKGLDVIAKIANLNDSIRYLLTNTDQDNIDKIAKQANDLDSSITLYKSSLVEAIKEIAGEEDDEPEITAVQDDKGLKL